jgi:hypothetical protein
MRRRKDGNAILKIVSGRYLWGGANGIGGTAGMAVCRPTDRLDDVRDADAEGFG